MRMRSILAACLTLSLLACSRSKDEGPSALQRSDAPTRIVSLDYCADQYVLEFADRDDILALSIDADKRFSYLRDKAKGLQKVRPRSADVLALQPDLIVRSYGGEPNIAGFMQRAGVPVVQVGFPQNIAEVREEVLRIGSALGQGEKARQTVDDMDRRLAALAGSQEGAPDALYMTPGGVTAGEGTLVHELMKAAGLGNFQTSAGWHPIPLERLAYERPDLVVAAFFQGEHSAVHNWSATRHRVAQAQLSDLPVAAVDGAWTSCGGWFLVEAVEVMAKTAKSARGE
ncbi:iron ABC transporter substrate-binding protein [Erythrobacter longus]|uniref:Iron ABC transporter substrate-binding protein n=1 Tax=Erythrobacter longus TaxID=1044 RepID=A0A074MFI5_ERYLO|nr:iron ABC transporter substrate-binding protein [Erythrobacter longus]